MARPVTSPGAAPTAESTVEALRALAWSHRAPVSRGLMSVVTLLFWAVWFYFITPIGTLVLWIVGIQVVGQQISDSGFYDMRQAILAYSTVLLGMVGLLALWIVWNVLRYGGAQDRRTVKRPDVTDLEVSKIFQVDDTIHAQLCDVRMARIDLDETDCVVVTQFATPRIVAPPAPAVLLPQRPIATPAQSAPELTAAARPAQPPPPT